MNFIILCVSITFVTFATDTHNS